jgi:hypothetical protein
MYTKLIEASKLQVSKGSYQLSYNEKNGNVQVIDRRNGKVNYVVSGESDPMLVATIVYFGLKSFQPETYVATVK